ncbi:Shikimate dehydrogenase (NADP(+)) [uncultured archaeon]|nr:Shikimate dehydrogenase (NADP(+)) [uncultured archaeon]
MASIDKDTTVCISLAARPSSFGSTLMNALFSELGMNWIYKPFAVQAPDLPRAIDAVRLFNIRGCGVSMPHKEAVMPLLDEVDAKAKAIGAVNTIVNDSGKLSGYNTDWVGALNALQGFGPGASKRVLVYGAGGAARAVIVAAKEWGASEIMVCNRTDSKAQELARKFGCTHLPSSSLSSQSADVFFNATPVGMAPHESEMPIDEASLSHFGAVADVVIRPLHSRLISSAEKAGLPCAPGWRMAMQQGLAQFKLYTGREPPLPFATKTVRELLARSP